MHEDAVISVAGLLGRPVIHKGGQEVGRLSDLVFRWDTKQKYPPLSGILVKVGRRLAWISAGDIQQVTSRSIQLGTARLDLRDFKMRSGEVRLAQDVLDHQLVDTNGVRVVRASDLVIATRNGTVYLVGVDVGYTALLRRLGPKAFLRRSPAGASVVDWAAVQSFGEQSGNGGSLHLSTARQEFQKLKPGQLADLLEDLGRQERQELLRTLSPEQAADALEEMQPDELESIIRESMPQQVAEYLAEMEPDEAADALRDVDSELREDLLERMPETAATHIEEVLSYDEDEAGGFMTTNVMVAPLTQTVSELQRRLAQEEDHYDIDAVAVVDAEGRLVYDLSGMALFLAGPEQKLSELVPDSPPVTAGPDESVKRVAELLTASRRSSIVVVDDAQHPVGRILADDVVDALIPERGRFHFPRVLS